MEEIIFKDRNQEYGAYSLRKNYGRHIIIALFIAVLFVGSALTYPLIMMPGEEPGHQHDTITITIVPLRTPPPEVVVPPPAVPSVPKQATKSLVFLAPKVSDEPENTDFGKQAVMADQKPVTIATPGDPGYKPAEPSEPVIPVAVNPEPKLVVEEMPHFPGGDAELQKFLLARINYPQEARDASIQGTVYLTFIVEPDGSITNIVVVRGISGGCDDEAIRVMKTMPDWIPGKQNGIPVRVRLTLPFKFTLR